MLQIKLPWPPSVNHYYKNAIRKTKQGKTYTARILTKRAEIFRDEVYYLTRGYEFGLIEDRNVRLMVHFYPPDKRKRDYDNLFKALQDALTFAAVWNDDSQVKECHWKECKIQKFGAVQVGIEAIK